ncbi:MAG: hypothetical protein HZA50_12965 [Planctomycetes bacterium]|nr:hypothetical protein [Planctomycetota bacterium]
MNRYMIFMLAAVLVCPPAAMAQDDQQSVEIYYQVTYSNGQVKDLPQPPETNQGIRMVVRIERYEGPGESRTVISTDPDKPVMTIVNPARTVTMGLAWNGSSWVDPRQLKKAAPAGQNEPGGKDDSAGAAPASIHYQVTYSNGKVADLNAVPQTKEGITRVLRITRYEDGDGYKVLSTDPDKPVMTIVNPGRTITVGLVWKDGAWVAPVEAVRGEIKIAKSALAPAAELPVPSGQVKLLDGPPDAGATAGSTAGGIIKPIESAKALPHRMQVWRLAPGNGRRNIVVSMAHSEAGALGAFYYVAYVDSDGDGLPDKLIARSDMVEAKKPGQWSNWTFTASEPVVFVGNAWPYETTSIYIGSPPAQSDAGKTEKQDNWRGQAVGVEAYVSGALWDPKFKKWSPILSNIRINTTPDEDQNKYRGPPVKIERTNP